MREVLSGAEQFSQPCNYHTRNVNLPPVRTSLPVLRCLPKKLVHFQKSNIFKAGSNMASSNDTTNYNLWSTDGSEFIVAVVLLGKY